jgi:hypothetical protein
LVSFALRCAALAALCLSPVVAWAEDPPPCGSPAAPAAVSTLEAARKVRAEFPEPAAAAAFEVQVEHFARGLPLGRGAFSATAEASLRGKAWRCAVEMALGPAEKPTLTLETVSMLGRDLRLLREEMTWKEGDALRTATAVRNDAKKGFDVGRPEAGTFVEEAAPDVTSDGFAALLLFLRLCPEGAAKYEVGIFKLGEDDAVWRIDVLGDGRLKDAGLGFDAEAWVAKATDGKRSVDVYLDRSDRGFLAMYAVEKAQWSIRKGLCKPKGVCPVPDIKQPAKSARDAGARFLMASLMGDLDVVGRSFHWASVLEQTKRDVGAVDEATLKGMYLDMLRPMLKDLHPDAAWRIVKPVMDASHESTGDAGATTVRFGSPFHRLTYTAKEMDGGWLITSLSLPK